MQSDEEVKMCKKILVPIAFSQYSQGILKFAAGLAAPLEAELFIVNIVNERDLEAVERISSFGYKVDGDHYVQTIQKERLEELRKLLANIDFPDDKINYEFLAGDPSTEILKFVVTNDIDMVVMGIKTREIRQIFAGSVAERIFHKCPVTVVSYREGDIAKRLRKRVLRHVNK